MFWYQGQLVQAQSLNLAVTDPAFLYGATVFTTLRVYQRSLDHPLTHWQSHCHRLSQSIRYLGWIDPNWWNLETGAKLLAENYPVLRLTIFADGRELILPRMLSPHLSQWQENGIRAWVANADIYRRYLPSQKTGNYLGAWLAKQEALNLQAEEAIITDSQGNWLETSTGNLWGYAAGCWYLPPVTDQFLLGIAQKHLLLFLQSQKLPVVYRDWSPNWVKGLEAIAYSNSVAQIVPIAQVQRGDKISAYDVTSQGIKFLKDYFKHSLD